MAQDFNGSKEWEAQVATHLPAHTIVRTDSTSELDFYLPALYVEAKEKRQKLNKRWHLLNDVEEPDLFVLDELSLRKALVHAPYSYFLLHDVPGGGRMFLASAVEVAVADRVRRNRVGKGKLILDLRSFRQIEGLEALMPTVTEDVTEQNWKRSECLSLTEIPQI
jgi:hypothetical protein